MTEINTYIHMNIHIAQIYIRVLIYIYDIITIYI
jgi:hypothetical protein